MCGVEEEEEEESDCWHFFLVQDEINRANFLQKLVPKGQLKKGALAYVNFFRLLRIQNKYLVNVVSCCRECTVVLHTIHTAILSTTTVNRFVNWKHHTNGEFTTGWVKPQPPFFPSEEHIEFIFFLVFSRCLVCSIKDVIISLLLRNFIY